MKCFTIFLALSAVLLLAATFPVGVFTSHPLRGNWKGIDAWDGSNMNLWIVDEARSGSKVFEISASDDRTGAWCGGPAEMKAVGVLEGENSVAVSMVWWCLPTGSNIIYFQSDTLSYNPFNDTITSSDGTVYKRTP